MVVSFAARLVCFAISLGGVLLTVDGSVATAEAAEKDELSSARAKFQQAVEIEQAGNYAQALQLFREVGQVRMTPQVRFHIATCEEKLGKLITALGGYELALNEAESLGPEFQKEVEERANTLRSRIPKLVIERGAGAKAAKIELDGIELGAKSVGVEVNIDPGPHSVQAKAPGYKPYSSTVEVAEGEVERLAIKLDKLAPDEKPVPEIAVTEKPPEEKGVRTTRILAYATGGLTIAAGAATFVFWSKRSSALDQMERLCGKDGTCADNFGTMTEDEKRTAQKTNDNLKHYDTLFLAGVATTGAAALATGLFIALEVWEKKPSKAEAFRLAPHAPGAELGGVSLVGRF